MMQWQARFEGVAWWVQFTISDTRPVLVPKKRFWERRQF